MKTNLYLLLLLQFVLINNVFSYSINKDSIVNDIVKTKSYRNGVYMSFEEFRKNSPSIHTFYIKYLKSEGQLELYSDSLKKEEIKGQIWGFCFGDSVYINTYYVPAEGGKKKNMYSPFNSIDRYCIFYYNYYYYGTGGYMNGGFMRSNKQLSSILMGLNINNGKTFEINKESIKAILVTDQELLKEYEELKPKDRNDLKYLMEFNKRNRSQIKDVN
jgi:hypothetical protein